MWKNRPLLDFVLLAEFPFFYLFLCMCKWTCNLLSIQFWVTMTLHYSLTNFCAFAHVIFFMLYPSPFLTCFDFIVCFCAYAHSVNLRILSFLNSEIPSFLSSNFHVHWHTRISFFPFSPPKTFLSGGGVTVGFTYLLHSVTR